MREFDININYKKGKAFVSYKKTLSERFVRSVTKNERGLVLGDLILRTESFMIFQIPVSDNVSSVDTNLENEDVSKIAGAVDLITSYGASELPPAPEPTEPIVEQEKKTTTRRRRNTRRKATKTTETSE